MDASNSFELKKILNSYPYFQSASAYYLKTLKSQEKDSYNKLLPKTAILTFNRSILRNWLHNDEIKDGQSNNKTEKYSFLDWFDIISDDKPKVDEKFELDFSSSASINYDFDVLEFDKLEKLEGNKIELGGLIMEHLVIALNPYPRKEGAKFEFKQDIADRDSSPFEILSSIK